MNLFRSHTPAGYNLVRQTDSELWFSRFDGHDSYSVALAFENLTGQTTRVSVVLKSFPD
jgi:pyruvate dehydrogenase complex dehydrogenase (E1) component